MFSDIKPDNILLDARGHAHFTDFNVAIHYSERRLHTSVAGSMAYMAPQVIGKKGYSWQADWWSLGITAYELILHNRPFEGRSAEKMTNSILKDPLRFPENADQRISEAGVSALKGVCQLSSSVFLFLMVAQLIERDPALRLGCRPHGQGFEDVKNHPWFSSLNWELIEAKDAQPPFVPDVSSRSLAIFNGD